MLNLPRKSITSSTTFPFAFANILPDSFSGLVSELGCVKSQALVKNGGCKREEFTKKKQTPKLSVAV